MENEVLINLLKAENLELLTEYENLRYEIQRTTDALRKGKLYMEQTEVFKKIDENQKAILRLLNRQ